MLQVVIFCIHNKIPAGSKNFHKYFFQPASANGSIYLHFFEAVRSRPGLADKKGWRQIGPCRPTIPSTHSLDDRILSRLFGLQEEHEQRDDMGNQAQYNSGIATRLATWNGDTSATPAIATIAAVIGDKHRPNPEVNSIGIRISTGSTLRLAAIFGARLAKAKNEALPDPMRNEQPTMMALITSTVERRPNPADCANWISLSTAPIFTRPMPNVSADDERNHNHELFAHAVEECNDIIQHRPDFAIADEFKSHRDHREISIAEITFILMDLIKKGQNTITKISGMVGRIA